MGDRLFCFFVVTRTFLDPILVDPVIRGQISLGRMSLDRMTLDRMMLDQTFLDRTFRHPKFLLILDDWTDLAWDVVCPPCPVWISFLFSHFCLFCQVSLLSSPGLDVYPVKSSCLVLHLVKNSCLVVHHVRKSCLVVHHVKNSCLVVHHVLGSCLVVYHVLGSSLVVYHVLGSSLVVYHVLGSSLVVYQVLGSCLVFYHVLGSFLVVYQVLGSCLVVYDVLGSCFVVYYVLNSCLSYSAGPMSRLFLFVLVYRSHRRPCLRHVRGGDDPSCVQLSAPSSCLPRSLVRSSVLDHSPNLHPRRHSIAFHLVGTEMVSKHFSIFFRNDIERGITPIDGFSGSGSCRWCEGRSTEPYEDSSTCVVHLLLCRGGGPLGTTTFKASRRLLSDDENDGVRNRRGVDVDPPRSLRNRRCRTILLQSLLDDENEVGADLAIPLAVPLKESVQGAETETSRHPLEVIHSPQGFFQQTSGLSLQDLRQRITSAWFL